METDSRWNRVCCDSFESALSWIRNKVLVISIGAQWREAGMEWFSIWDAFPVLLGLSCCFWPAPSPFPYYFELIYELVKYTKSLWMISSFCWCVWVLKAKWIHSSPRGLSTSSSDASAARSHVPLHLSRPSLWIISELKYGFCFSYILGRPCPSGWPVFLILSVFRSVAAN